MKGLFFILFLWLFNFASAQSYHNFEKTLSETLSKDSLKDGRWVFFAEDANIMRIDKPLVKSRIPSYDFFEVTLTNYLGYHVNQGTCLVLYDSIRSKILLIEPLWYSGISESLIKMFIGEKFNTKDSLLNFLKELHELMEVGSVYRFINSGYTDNLITYDLGYFSGDSYTTGGNGTSSTIRYNQNGVWRKIMIDLKNHSIVRYTAINPKTNDEEIIK